MILRYDAWDRIGALIDPCGTPRVKVDALEQILMEKEPLIRYDFNQFGAVPLIHYTAEDRKLIFHDSLYQMQQ